MELGGPDEVLYVSNTPLLEGKDLTQARVETRLFGPDLLVTVTPEGAKRLRDVTSSHIGARLAVVVNHVLISAPIIRMAIEDGEMAITSARLTKSDLEELAEKINSSVKR